MGLFFQFAALPSPPLNVSERREHGRHIGVLVAIKQLRRLKWLTAVMAQVEFLES